MSTGLFRDENPFTGSGIPPVVLAVAIEQSNHSLCVSKRGCAIWGERIHSTQPLIIGRGYNKHTGIRGCLQNSQCKVTCRSLAVHAEQVALMDALHNNVHIHNQPIFMVHVKTQNNKLVPSGPPSCVQCSKLILASPMRITGVYLFHEQGWGFYPTIQFHALSMENEGRKESVVALH